MSNPRNGLRKRWRWRGETSPLQTYDPAGEVIAKQLRLRPLLGQLLIQRGWSNADDAQPFLDPKLTQLHDPALLPGATRAAERINQAITDKQHIVIYGDYDVDGVTASAILWHILTLAGADISTYVPHRIEEGYGLNTKALEELASEYTDDQGRPPVIISVDCGITGIEPAKAMKQLGVDLIITDHHEFDSDNLPDAFALVHPRIPDPQSDTKATYPFPELCGAGVAFKLAWHIAKIRCGSDRLPKVFRELMIDLLALTALGTVADIVPLIDENRVITRFGLNQMKHTRFAGLNALIDATDLRDKPIDSFHIGFVLGPRINACGRMSDAGAAVHLLTQATPAEAAQLAKEMSVLNQDRRDTEKDIVDQAHQQVEDNQYDSPDSRGLVLGDEGWHPGVIGIVASRMIDRYHRPTIVLNFDTHAGEANGSARSVDGVSIHAALEHCKAHLTTFGGHEMAAGLRLPLKNVDSFRKDFVAYINEQLTVEELIPVLEIDSDCNLADIDANLIAQLDNLAPFGRSNDKPVLSVQNVKVASPPQRVGSEGKHLKLRFRQGNQTTAAIGFNMGEYADQLPAGIPVDIAFQPTLNMWNGNTTVDLHLKDIRLREQE